MEPDTTTITSRDSDSPAADGVALAPGDPRAVFAAAVATGGSVIAAVRADQLDLPTPCADFTVRDLLGHLVAVLDRVAVLGRGEDPFAPGTEHVVPQVADDGWSAAWTGAAHRVHEVWTDDAVLELPMALPWMTAPGAAVLGSYTCEVTVHTWDLASAVGARPDWDARAIAVADASIRHGLPAEGRLAAFEAITAAMPEDQRSGTPPFAEAVDVPDDAAAIDRLVAWTGRRP
jgi:uncharacterized protein (TIGR03086 family)